MAKYIYISINIVNNAAKRQTNKFQMWEKKRWPEKVDGNISFAASILSVSILMFDSYRCWTLSNRSINVGNPSQRRIYERSPLKVSFYQKWMWINFGKVFISFVFLMKILWFKLLSVSAAAGEINVYLIAGNFNATNNCLWKRCHPQLLVKSMPHWVADDISVTEINRPVVVGESVTSEINDILSNQWNQWHPQ